MGDFLDWQHKERVKSEAPLAARMRPRVLDEFVGQEHIVGPGRLLRRAIEADRLSSLIFHGPPGTGKTTLAQIIAGTTSSHFIQVNAVLAGVKDLRQAIAEAQRRRKDWQQRTILFVDEVHRFNKSQQDALLPWVENGTVVLVGATTENPYFEVNKALVSRSRVFQLRRLGPPELERVLEQALSDRARGYGSLEVVVEPEARAHLVNVSGGDARVLLSALELAVETTPPVGSSGVIVVDLGVAEESIQQRAVLYDKEGDAHFDIISAYIKSLRGSDPDAALYWLARMVYAGEDPRYIFRRLLIQASEDVGVASGQALVVVEACAAAYDRVGMPEGRFHLAQATLCLANAPKSNSTMGFFDALAAVKKERDEDVPSHLKDPARDKKGFGHGEGYRYPHAYQEHWVAQQYLPEGLQGRVFYQPSDQGEEAGVRLSVERRREAAMAAMAEGVGVAPGEVLTWSPEEPAVQRWLQRTVGGEGRRLGGIRDRVFGLADCKRHHVVLDPRASSGLLVYEAVRQAPEGCVVAAVASREEAETLRAWTTRLPELLRPLVLESELEELEEGLGEALPGVAVDRIVGRNVLVDKPDKAEGAVRLAALLGEEGVLVLAETVARRGQRLYRLPGVERLPEALWERLVEAEEAIYTDGSNPMVGWDEAELKEALEGAGLEVLSSEVEVSTTPIQVTPGVLD